MAKISVTVSMCTVTWRLRIAMVVDLLGQMSCKLLCELTFVCLWKRVHYQRERRESDGQMFEEVAVEEVLV
jgi:hypothetical protein